MHAVPKFHLTLTRRVWALAVIALATMGLGTGLALYQFNNLNFDHRRAELRHEVEMAVTLVKNSGASADRPESVRAALEALRPIRIGETGYIFAVNMKGDALLSPLNPKVEGTSLLGVKDKAGGHPFQEMLRTAATVGSGFITYIWTKPGDAAEHQKTSYIQAIPELGVMIGSGVYFDDLLAQIIGVTEDIALMVAPLLALFLGFAWFIGHSISRRLGAMTRPCGKWRRAITRWSCPVSTVRTNWPRWRERSKSSSSACSSRRRRRAPSAPNSAGPPGQPATAR